MRQVLVFVLGLFLGACVTARPPATSSSDHRAEASALEGRTVALVNVDDDGEARAYCSGVWVGTNTIVTAHHCMGEEDVVGTELLYLVHDDVFSPHSTSERRTMRPRAARLAAIDDAHDLALLESTEGPQGHPMARLHEGAIQQGSFAQAMGHSLGLWYSYSTGVVAAVREKDFGDGTLMVWVQATTPISPGNSGGGLFDSDGYLIGICHAMFTKGQSLNLFVHSQYVRVLMGGVK